MTLQDFKVNFPGVILTVTIDQKRIWRYFREDSHIVNFIQDLGGEFSEYDDLLVLIDLLKEVDENLMFVDIDNLTVQEWKTLQQWEGWLHPGDYAFWQSMTSGLSFTERLKALHLSPDDAVEIFGISPAQFDKWEKEGLPVQVVEQFSLLDAKVYVKLGEWGDYCRGSVDCSDVVGIPGYETVADYYECDRETSREFPFLPLYKAFCYQLEVHLKDLGIRAVVVNINYHELRKWLSKNRYPLIPGARFLFATYKRQGCL